MPSGTVGAPRRADARANHTAVLEAAAALVGRCGPDLPYDEIALAAGVGRATVYRHFPTREALSRAIITAALDHWEAVLADLNAGPGGFEALFRAWVRIQQGRSHGVDLLTRSAPEDALRQGRRRFEASLRAPTRDAQDAGVLLAGLTSRDVRIVLTMLSAALRSPEASSDRRRAIELAPQPAVHPRLRTTPRPEAVAQLCRSHMSAAMSAAARGASYDQQRDLRS